jgi:hypothetical protein
MKKYLLISLLASTISTYGMESSSSFLSSLVSRFSSSATKNDESEKILKLRDNKAAFEKVLLFPRLLELQKTYVVPITLQLFLLTSIDNDPPKFLRYIYYKKFHKNELSFNLENLKLNSNLLIKCKEATISGYSALGAAVVAQDIGSKEKRELIQELISLGFEPTSKDRELACLELYERSADDIKRKLVLAYGHKDQQSPLSKLPYEIIQYIGTFVPSERSLILE